MMNVPVTNASRNNVASWVSSFFVYKREGPSSNEEFIAGILDG